MIILLKPNFMTFDLLKYNSQVWNSKYRLREVELAMNKCSNWDLRKCKCEKRGKTVDREETKNDHVSANRVFAVVLEFSYKYRFFSVTIYVPPSVARLCLRFTWFGHVIVIARTGLDRGVIREKRSKNVHECVSVRGKIYLKQDACLAAPGCLALGRDWRIEIPSRSDRLDSFQLSIIFAATVSLVRPYLWFDRAIRCFACKYNW